ncbi:MAG: hypothetical protein WEC12_06695 [Balneolaceae bacterium]
MNRGSRIFAYTTWVVMISLAIIVFTNNFLVYIADPDWIGLVALLGFGFIYLNFSYFINKRYIRKVLQKTSIHYLLALLIFLPPAAWVIFISDRISGGRILFLVVIAFACGLGAVYGYRAGKRQQQKQLDRLRERE